MRWQVKHYDPQHGDVRTVKRFCLFPRYFYGTWVWLEWVFLVQEYDSNYADDGWKTTAIYNKDQFNKP